MTILNAHPYYDDYEPNKNYHQILFKPGYAVQARELTQLQTILQEQITRFGNHIFKHGSMVIPGAIQADLVVPYAKLDATLSSVAIADDLFLEGDEITGATYGVKAIVKGFANIVTIDGVIYPKTVYFKYISGGVTNSVLNGVSSFIPGEEIFKTSNTSIRAKIQEGSTESVFGYGSLAYITDGVYYVNGKFVAVQKQTLIADRYRSDISCKIGLYVEESIVNSDSDETLLDPSQGSYNYAAPGADRLRVNLTLIRYDYDYPIADDFIELMRYNEGYLEEHVRFPKYSELEKSLAKRTFEESGNYRVEKLNISLNEHKRILRSTGKLPNKGLYIDGDITKFVIDVSPGSAYINGFNVDKVGRTRAEFDKARNTVHTLQKTDVNLRPEVGQYLYVSDITGGVIGFSTRPQINLYLYGTTTIIGTANTYTIDQLYGSGTGRILALGIYNLALNSSYTLANVGGFALTATTAVHGKVCQKYKITNPILDFAVDDVVTYNTTVRVGTVKAFDRSTLSLYVYRHNATVTPIRGDFIVTGTNSATVSEVYTSIGNANSTAIFQLPFDNVKRVKNSSNLTNIKYYIWKHLPITTNGSGAGSVNTSAGEQVLAIEDGTFIAYSTSGILSNTLFSLNPGQTTVTIAGGPVSSAIMITCVVEKNDIQERTKTVQTGTITASINGANPVVTLSHRDIKQITSVILDPTVTAVDVINICRLDGGQRDMTYEYGRVTYAATLSAAKDITINYTYYAHSTGDYFSIDSYAATLGSTVYDDIGTYNSSSGQRFQLQNCLDFRYSGTDSGIPVSNYSITTDVQRFVGYNVLVYLDNNDVKFVIGTPSENPITPKTPNGVLRIGQVFVPPYTPSINSIRISEDNNYRYTMADIAKIDNRVTTLEYFSTLTMKEKNLVDFNIIDSATGLNRFKSGLIVEEFKDQLVSSNIYSNQSSISYLASGITAAVSSDQNRINMLGSGDLGSSNYRIADTNKVLIDYDEVEWSGSFMSSSTENLNPYLVFNWVGELKLTPDFDSFISNINLPDIVNNMALTNTVTVNREVTTIIQAPTPPPRVVDNVVESTPVAAIAPVTVIPKTQQTVNVGNDNNITLNGVDPQNIPTITGSGNNITLIMRKRK